MMQTSGIYHDGKVILKQSVDWPDGIQVNVVCENAEAKNFDQRVDGSSWEDSPEATQKWLAWFDASQPVFEGRELEKFEASLRANREQERELLPTSVASCSFALKVEHEKGRGNGETS
jgi:hypothetical protein